jgi:hypothetical protein
VALSNAASSSATASSSVCCSYAQSTLRTRSSSHPGGNLLCFIFHHGQERPRSITGRRCLQSDPQATNRSQRRQGLPRIRPSSSPRTRSLEGVATLPLPENRHLEPHVHHLEDLTQQRSERREEPSNTVLFPRRSPDT